MPEEEKSLRPRWVPPWLWQWRWLILFAVFILVWWLVPPLLYRHTGTPRADKLKAITDTRTALLAGLIGVALLLWWRPASMAAGDGTIACLVLALLAPAAWHLSRAVARVDNSTSIR